MAVVQLSQWLPISTVPGTKTPVVSDTTKLLVSEHGVTVQIPSRAREVFDVSGAGDTVTAWVATALAAGATALEASYLGNYAAGVEVAKSGVATVAPAEVLAAYDAEHDAVGRLRRNAII